MSRRASRIESDRVASHRDRRRRGWRWSLSIALALLVAASLTMAVFQLGWPWSSGERDHLHVHRADGGARQHYQVHLPPQYDGRTELPVVLAIHGCGMTGFGWNSM